jgi:hypothetical protein
MIAGEIGMMATPAEGRSPEPYPVWAADNGCFGKGFPGEPAWTAWLEKLSPHADRCLFATAPDVVGDAQATLDRSLPHLPAIRAMGYPAALVAQDGLEDLEVPWDAFDVLFIGGSTDWKLGPAARRLVAEAKARCKWVHMGRVNSRRRWSYAEYLGCDSVDGTFLAFGPDVNLPRLASWITQPGFDFGGAA